MIVVNVFTESGCSFEEGEYELSLESVVHDRLDLRLDPERIEECIKEYDGEIKQEVIYTFFLHRANIATAFPGYEPAFAIQQVIENIEEIDVKL